jgi:plasmid stabilization system protein ParE
VLYRITDEALGDLDEINDFIANRSQNPRGAETVETYLFDAFERIGRSPDRCGGKSWPHITTLPVKFLTVRKYIVIYDDRSLPVNIVAVVGGRRDLERLFAADTRYWKLRD